MAAMVLRAIVFAAVLAAALAAQPLHPAAQAPGAPAGDPPPLAPTGGRGLTEVHGLRVGQVALKERPTGCTVILVEGEGAVGGVAQRGGAPGTRETDLLDPLNMVDKVNAVALSGGSAYGLDVAQGVVRYLEEKSIGWRVGPSGVVPIVPAAILFDLGFGGNPRIRPTADCGYQAATAASSGPVAEGNVGAGTGATVGKMGMGRSMKAGLGSAAIRLPNGLVVGAIVAVNAVGDIVDPQTGQIVAGVRTEDGKALADVRKLLRSGVLLQRPQPRPGENTTIGLVATNARLTKAEVARLALMGDDGLAKAIVPSHTVGDGDTVFSLATGRWQGTANLTVIGAMAAEAMAEAVVRAASAAETLSGVPSARSLGTVPARLK
jgi:L-aminopeptidase/D-esterase-like protein